LGFWEDKLKTLEQTKKDVISIIEETKTKQHLLKILDDATCFVEMNCKD